MGSAEAPHSAATLQRVEPATDEAKGAIQATDEQPTDSNLPTVEPSAPLYSVLRRMESSSSDRVGKLLHPNSLLACDWSALEPNFAVGL